LDAFGIEVRVEAQFREPYSLWRKMNKNNSDFNHIPYRHIIQVVFSCENEDRDSASILEQEKKKALEIYARLTNVFREKPSGIINYIDSPKENGYQSFHVRLLSDFGSWEELHISSERMVMASQLGVIDETVEDNIQRWIAKFLSSLNDMESHQKEGNYIEDVVSTFYNDDIIVFTPMGDSINLPKKATALDFAFEIHTDIGLHAHFARINGLLCSVKTELHRGDLVEIVTNENVYPQRDWIDRVLSYKAKRALKTYMAKQLKSGGYHYCSICKPIPGEEVIGFKENDGSVTVHKRNCPQAIRQSSKKGDSIVSVNYNAVKEILYPVSIHILAIDRFHLLWDIIDCITNEMHLSMNAINTTASDCIVNSTISFGVHSHQELITIMERIKGFDGVEEVRRTL
jgi:GTP pyrophosphokinase